MSKKPRPSRSIRRSIGISLPAAVVAATMAVDVPAAAAEPWPSRVEATYRITFNGFDIGKFDFTADVSGSSYTVKGDARVSALLGAFKWQGETRSAGQLAGLAPRPAGYTFDFNANGRAGSIKLGFERGAVKSIASLPPKPADPDAVPLQPQHLAGVLDPLSAVLALSRTTSGNPCGRSIPVFDGKQRFDLQLAFIRQQAVAEARPSGQPGVAFVCRVRYVPIAGHGLNNSGTRQLASSNEIEIALRPVPSAGLFVPYSISIPTGAGTAMLTSERVNIVTRSEQIALTH